MKKERAIKLFGSVQGLATALRITRQAVYQWPQQLPTDQTDRVMGAALRLGKLPCKCGKESVGRKAA